MKKLLILAVVIIGAVMAHAVGPKIPCILIFTPSPSPGVTGYWLYWRATNEVYSDTQRWAMPTNAASGYDLRVLGLAKNTYWLAASATNATAESDLSAECAWLYLQLNRPSNLTVNLP